MKPANLVVIMSDEHSRKVLGCYGHPHVHTPNIDRLAARGTRYASAYTPSPICVPARACFATGRHVHEIGCWDNAFAYDGSRRSWHHALRERGHEVVSIGKLHFRSPKDDNGFSREIIPMHIVDEVGDVLGLLRDRVFERGGAHKLAAMAGPGESSYTAYDRQNVAHAQVWLREEAPKLTRAPWVLFLSFVVPHFPLTAPPDHYYRYARMDLPLPKLYRDEERPLHPYLKDYAESFTYDRHFTDEASVRRALAGYYGLCGFLDENVGKVLRTLEETGLSQTTRVVYTSDHGDNLGARGLWGKSTMYEEAVGVPLIVAGPDIPSGAVEERPVSLLDLVPFILEGAGESAQALADDLPGRSLLAPEDRPILSQYHATGSRSAAYMVRVGALKYVYYANPEYPAQLFDLSSDPEELVDLGPNPDWSDRVAHCHEVLRGFLDPDEVDRRARREQERRVEELGGPDAILARGDFGYSPPPGVSAVFS